MSKDALKRIGEEVRSWRLHLRTGRTFGELARAINPIVRGWMQYYGAFYRSALYPLLSRINAYLVRWIRKKYKRLQARKKAMKCWQGITERHPRMFAHWKWVPSVPREEQTLAVYDDLIRQGKLRYVALSNHPAWQLTEALWIADDRRMASAPVCAQVMYSLLDRSAEAELSAACVRFGLSIVPYAPCTAACWQIWRSWTVRSPETSATAAPDSPKPRSRSPASSTAWHATGGWRCRRSRSHGCCPVRPWPR